MSELTLCSATPQTTAKNRKSGTGKNREGINAGGHSKSSWWRAQHALSLSDTSSKNQKRTKKKLPDTAAKLFRVVWQSANQIVVVLEAQTRVLHGTHFAELRYRNGGRGRGSTVCRGIGGQPAIVIDLHKSQISIMTNRA